MFSTFSTACSTFRGTRDAAEFIDSNMTAGDRDTLPAGIVANNLTYAMLARTEFPWAAALPDSIFLNDVLPYAVVDEPRDDWRATLYNIFAPQVRGAADIREAIAIVNKNISKDTGVSYNTRRAYTNQNPSSSMEQGMASCTGLSILLVDAFRSVGIPARFAGVASWHDNRGNHSWVEVWVDGQWLFTEFKPDPAGLDHAWFLDSAGQADAGNREYAVWATSFAPTGTDDYFPMIWSPDSREIHAINVTDHYTSRYRELAAANAAAGTHVPVRFTMWKDKAHATHSDDRVAANVDVFHGEDQVSGGRTAEPTDDMNNALTFSLAKNTEYTFMYADAAGEIVNMTVAVGEEAVDVNAYME
jgi:transglutaminase-like putative cysteine protease